MRGKVPWHRGRVMSFMASLADVAGQAAAAEGYLLELLSWCAFAEVRPGQGAA